MGRCEVLRTGRHLAPYTSMVTFSWPTVLLLMLLCLFPKALGIRTTVLPGNQVNYGAVISRGGGVAFGPLVASQLTCVTLHDSYWQLEHFIPPPFSAIELVVVLYSFHGIGALMRRKPLSVS